MLAAMDVTQEREWAEKYRAAVQARISDPVLAAAAFRGHSPGLPDDLVLAVTDQAVHAFAYRPRGFSIRLKDQVALWRRADLGIAVHQGELSTLLTLEPRGGAGPLSLSSTSDDLSGHVLTELLRE
jgi:hypothetical protein